MAPMRARSSVVLPAPLRPMSPHMSPSSTESETLRRIGTGPIATLRSDTLSMALPAAYLGAADEGLHALVGQRRGGRAVGDHGAVVEGEHPVGEPCHDLHVVLHEQDRDTAGAQRRHDHVHDAELLLD